MPDLTTRAPGWQRRGGSAGELAANDMTLPDIATTVPALRARVAAWRSAGERVALVPTMGALHEGHLELARRGRHEADRVIVSIFVNPKQFGPNEDFAKYPRAGERDRALLAGLAELVFAPTPEVMYPEGFSTGVTVTGPSEGFEGAIRPGHFDGVATVVCKLFLQAAPDVAVFGEKDWQQLQVVKRMVRDLDLPLLVVGHPTVRDDHGLALSSRNAYLSPTELATARALNGILKSVAAGLRSEEWAACLARGREAILAAGLGPIDYLAAVDARSLAPLDGPGGREARLVAAVRLGPVRLLDNMPVPR